MRVTNCNHIHISTHAMFASFLDAVSSIYRCIKFMLIPERLATLSNLPFRHPLPQTTLRCVPHPLPSPARFIGKFRGTGAKFACPAEAAEAISMSNKIKRFALSDLIRRRYCVCLVGTATAPEPGSRHCLPGLLRCN